MPSPNSGRHVASPQEIVHPRQEIRRRDRLTVIIVIGASRLDRVETRRRPR
jgi:hypothetical protein